MKSLFISLTDIANALLAGSAGDPNAPQLIIDNRAVQLEYARDMSDKKKDFNQNNRFNNDRGKDDKRPVKTDWLCEAVSFILLLIFLY